jgi:hypothetical protein
MSFKEKTNKPSLTKKGAVLQYTMVETREIAVVFTVPRA